MAIHGGHTVVGTAMIEMEKFILYCLNQNAI